MAGVPARLPVPHHVAQPGVGDREHHVVRYDVEDQAHAPRVQRRRQALERGAPAQIRLHGVRVDHVIAVRRSGIGRKDRGQVERPDPQIVEIGHQRLGAGQVDAAAKLQAIGAGG